MKKLVLAIAVVASAMFVACNSSEKKADESANAIVSKIENCTNPDSVQVYVEQAKEFAQQLVKEGKIEEAKAYLEKVEPIVKEKVPALAGTFDTVKEALGTVADTAAGVVGDAKDAANAAGDSIVNAANAKVDELTQEATDKANAAVEEGKAKAAEQVNAAADKAKEKLNGLLK